MGFESGTVTVNNSLSNNSGRKTFNRKLGVVYDVILDESHELIKDSGFQSRFIGAIQFRTSGDETISDAKSLPLAYPMEMGFKDLPTRNETVEIYEFTKGYFGYRRLKQGISPNVNGVDNLIDVGFPSNKSETGKSKKYSEVQSTQISRTNTNKSNTIGYGKYYQPQEKIHNLKMYEGDTLIESSFGQSIRFSAYNNDKKTFAPTIIIRNGESPENRQKDENLPVQEDINGDGSVIVMSSSDYQLDFKSTTDTQPDSFPDLPSKLVGNQILLNSDRIILSSKTEEMRFYSKKGFAFASDGDLSFDVNSVEFFTKENFTFSAKDRILTFDSGDAGKIYLGSNTNDLEPMVKGNRLVFILAKLIEVMGQAQYATPAGVTAPGPTSVEKLQTLQRELNSCLSRKTFTV